ncbi:UNVERIFIED_CONTAM: hypothetical protein GTU68_058019 [Idotea baltica]|nr:hypothetical protein [Idotea baltica]
MGDWALTTVSSKTTRTPISSTLSTNTDATPPKDYSQIKDRFRPGPLQGLAPTNAKILAIRDYSRRRAFSSRDRNGPNALGCRPRRAIRVLCVQVAPGPDDRGNWGLGEVGQPIFLATRCRPPPGRFWADYLDGVRKAGSSVGAVVEIVAEGVPAGWGAPVYGKLDTDISAAMMSINAVKGVEIGNGFAAAGLTGEENADEIRIDDVGQPLFLTNNAGGVLGGISNGDPLVARFAVKPTSSILTERKSITRQGEEVDVMTKGRHDPCVGIRAVPVGEAMMACVLADHFLRHRGQVG